MIEKYKVPYEDSWVFFAFMGGIIIFLLIYTFYSSFFHRDSTKLFNLIGLSTDKTDNKSYFMYRVLVLSGYSYVTALLLSLFVNLYDSKMVGSIDTFCLVFVGVLVFVIVKLILNGVIFWVFDLTSMSNSALFKDIAIKLSLSFYTLITMFLLYYSGFWYFLGGFNVLIIFSLIYLFIYIVAMSEFFVYKVRYFLYFIFYLCTVELCPLIIAWNIFRHTSN